MIIARQRGVHDMTHGSDYVVNGKPAIDQQ